MHDFLRSFLALVACFFVTSLYAAGPDDFDINPIAQKAGAALTVNCPIGIENSPCVEKDDRLQEMSSYSSPIGNTVPVSVISETLANALFKKVASKSYIPFRYPMDGCYARAHEMSRILEDNKVISAKVFVEGDLRVETTNSPEGFVTWWYHVAPIVKVKVGGIVKDMVFDPSIFNKPVPLEEWIAIQTKHTNGRADAVYYTKRYNYHPGNKDEERDAYASRDISDMKDTMSKYMQYLREMDKKRPMVQELERINKRLEVLKKKIESEEKEGN